MDVNFPKLEEKILKFWKNNQIFEKSVKWRKKSRNFVFYEGPPTANGRPGIHHVLARAFKDIICRYKTMRGFRVERKAGWDTHGLPVELEAEKQLGLKSKKEIEKYGIVEFNKKCKESVWKYKEEWERLTERIGYWIDLKNPYIPYAPEYIETLWRILKEFYRKNLLLQDYKVVHHCPRCGTSLSSHEVALGYKQIKEPAVFVKLRIKNPEYENCSLLVWTTTPWTLPANVAVAVNSKITYVKVKTASENFILAKERIKAVGVEGEILQEFQGKDLAGLVYEAPYPQDGEIAKNAYRIVLADFVSLYDGTGLVHIAPAFGQDDMEVGRINKLPTLLNVGLDGKFNLEVKKWAGIFVKEADPLIIEDLAERNLLFKKEDYTHDYPFCWRCYSPLLYYAKKSWFIKVTEYKNILIKNNEKINWVPSHLKEGRFGEWLKDVKDWAISRERYWGTPLPIWQCKSCKNTEVIGSLKDLSSKKFSKNNYFILRHGESLKNKKDIASCWPEKGIFPLTKKGEMQVKAAAGKLKKSKIDLIFSSDLLRTKQTAEILGEELGVKPKFDKNLREVNAGILNGKKLNEAGKFWSKNENLSAKDYYSRRFEKAPPKGENYVQVEKRIYGFLKELEEKYSGKNIVIISHARVLTLLEKIVYGYNLERFVRIIKGKKEIKTGGFKMLDFAVLPYNENMEIDLHRPYIDDVRFYCQKCQGQMERVPEVADVWFDSGSMPFAQNPLPGKTFLPKLFPADYISEAVDQTRGWFYTLHAVAGLLVQKPAFKNVISLGHILDEKGEKMSKSKGNIVDPWQISEKYGIDAVRWYFYTINQPGDSKLFSEKDVAEAQRKFVLTFWNCFTFFQTYGSKNSKSKIQNPKLQFKIKNLLDKWILSKLNRLILEATESLDKYDVVGAARAVGNFIIEDLSLWYIRRSRRRFQQPEFKTDLEEASAVLYFVFMNLTKLIAPFIPFLSEEFYQQLIKNSAKSVHLENWPDANKKLIDEKLEKEMETTRKIVALALAERAKAGIKVRQPLSKLKIKNLKLKINDELLSLIKDEINVKEVVFDEALKAEIELDKNITSELQEEGNLREFIRQIQDLRKKSGLNPQDKIKIYCSGGSDLEKLLEKNKEFVLKEARARNLVFKKAEKLTLEIRR